MSTRADVIRAELLSTIEAVVAAAADFPWTSRTAYAEWVAQTYYLVRHTTRFLALAAGACGVDEEDLHRATLRHLREEEGHAELALEDVVSLGFGIEQFCELPQTRLLYQSQYYYLERHGPIAHLGYSLLLEGLAATAGEAVLRVVESTLGMGVTRFLRAHAADDEEHFEGSLSRLASHASDRTLASALANLEQGALLYTAMLETIAGAERARRRVAA